MDVTNGKELLYRIFHMPCLFQLLTGLYCPGCGGTRAVRYLLSGDIAKSIQYHPLVFYCVVVAGLLAIMALIARMTGNRRWYPGHEKLFLYLGAGIILLNWIVKNYYLVVKGIDLLPAVL